MDSRPFRVPESSDRKAPAAAPEPVRARPEPVEEEAPRAPRRNKDEKKSVRSFKLFRLPFLIGAVIVVVLAGIFIWSTVRNSGTAIDGGKYQAVFFTNGQVYFGKLHAFNDGYMRLTDVYYLQTKTSDSTDSENPQKTTASESDIQLIKLGDEIHGPEDEMVISKDQVLFYENLKEDGKVTQSIEQHKRTTANN